MHHLKIVTTPNSKKKKNRKVDNFFQNRSDKCMNANKADFRPQKLSLFKTISQENL